MRLVIFLSRGGWSKETILAEIAKCDTLCANCHRKLHYAANYGLLTPKQQQAFNYDYRKFKTKSKECKKCGNSDVLPKRRLCVLCWNDHQAEVMRKRRVTNICGDVSDS